MNGDFLIMRTHDGKDLPLPVYMSEQAAGMDLYANVPKDGLIVEKGAIALVPTGVKIALPKGFEAQIRPRSGLALKYGVTLVNAPGTIDADYRGEIKVIVINHGQADYVVARGSRIAQMVVAKVETVAFREVDALSETQRGSGGFGHTGF